MVKRKLATITASLALLIPTSVFALGLGNISMNSALDQHLKAEILIHSATADDLEKIKVNLASGAMFAQYGIDRPAFLEGLKFKVVKGTDGNSYIELSSVRPIREPFLNFLVEAKWPNGHTLRQFTVLVDPPTMMEKVQVQVTPVRVSAPVPLRNTRSAAAVRHQAPVAQPLSSTTNTGAIEYGPSRANDTLWGIAKAMRGNRDVNIHQVMLAILRDNPAAFSRNNVNNLKMGYVLRINDPATIASVSKADAVREISRQYQDWKNNRSTPSAGSTESKKSAKSSTPAESTATKNPEPAQLKLTSAGSDGEGQGDATEAQNGDVSKRLAIANEQLLANQQETGELAERLVKLEGQLESLQRLVQLKDSQLAAVQQSAKAAPAPASAAVVAQQPEPAAEGLFDSPLALGLIALVVLLIGALGFLLFQRRKQAEHQESILSQSAEAPVSEIPAGATMAASVVASSTVSLDGTESSLLTDFSTTSMEGLQSDIGEIDPISEADVYLAYGRYTQAEEIIQDALQSDSGREEYHTKLLEIYHASGENDKFLEAAQNYHGTLGGNLLGDGWVKVCAMGREIQPGNALFTGAAAADHDIAESNQALNEAESLESESLEAASSMASGSDSGISTDESSRDDLDSFDFSALDDQIDPLNEQALKESFSELESSTLDKTEPALGESNSMEFDAGSMDDLNRELSGDEVSDQQKLDEDIALNSLEFGSDSPDDKKSKTDISGDDSTPDVLNVTDDALHTIVENDDLDLSNSLEEMTAEFNEEAAKKVDETDVNSFDFETLEELGGENRSAETSSDIESDLLEMADALDQSAGTESKKEANDLDSFDLGSLTDNSSDFDDDNPFADLDEVGTKLDLARAYVDMGDKEGAQSIVDEVMQEGTDEQKEEAQALLKQI